MVKKDDIGIRAIEIDDLPIIQKWLKDNNVPYDEIRLGKPWCGLEGFYIDDKTIRPDEFIEKSYEEIVKIIK